MLLEELQARTIPTRSVRRCTDSDLMMLGRGSWSSSFEYFEAQVWTSEDNEQRRHPRSGAHGCAWTL